MPRGELFFYHPRLGLRIAPLHPGGMVVVGRTLPADVVFPDESLLSGRHASFTADDRGVVVEDLGSRAGTWIGTNRIDGRRRLGDGEAATLGAVTAWFHATDAPIPAPQMLSGHETFEVMVRAEIDRSRTFHHPLAVVVVRGVEHGTDVVPSWTALVREHLRIVDSVALFAPDEVEILLPEAPRSYAMSVAQAMVADLAPRGRVVCGIVVGPSPRATADTFVAAAHEAALEATGRGPIVEHEASEPVPRVVSDEAPVVLDPAMVEIYEQIDAIAPSLLPVLIDGESGTGKEVVARAIHARSLRAGTPLRIIDCGAYAPTLIESELFGHERGSFTGAYNRTIGPFEDARGGTVFLDEIGNMPIGAQAKLLRVLDRGIVQRVGSTAEIRVDVRVIAATNSDLDVAAANGSFRSDLLFRLKAVRLRLPPLRERPRELRALVDRFLAEANARAQKAVRHIDPEALAKLLAWQWPGNVRELKQEMERMVVIAPGDTLTVALLAKEIRDSTPSIPPRRREERIAESLSLGDRTQAYEMSLIRAALGASGDNQVRASRLLRMSRRTLVDKMRRYGIRSGDPGLSLPPDADGTLDYAARVEHFQRAIIGEALARTSGDAAEAARLLRIQLRTLRKWIGGAGVGQREPH